MLKKLILVLIIILIFSSPVLAEEWTTFQKNLGMSYISFVAIDLIQSQHWIEYTKYNPKKVDNWIVYENNPFVAGKSIETATLLALAGNYVLFNLFNDLEGDYRTLALLSANLIEGYVIYNNHKTMKRFNFDYKVNFISFSF